MFREQILDALLDRALERPRAVDRVETGLGELREGAVSNFEPHLELRQSLLEVTQLDLRDVPDVLLVQRVEHDDLVDAVDELGPELRLHLRQDRGLDEAGIVALHLLDHVRAEVGGHHDHGVLEIHGAALAVGHAAVVEHLQEHVEHVGVSLFDLVEQDHAVGLSAHRLGEVPAFLVADVAGRRADQARDRMLLHEFGHVDADEVILRIEQESRERLAQLGLAHARGAQE